MASQGQQLIDLMRVRAEGSGDAQHDGAPRQGRPLWAAGFSFGSWIALEAGAVDDRVTVLIGIAPPVTKEGYDFSRTLQSTKPKFFVQGEADDICPVQDMWKFYGRLLEPKELVVIDGADHLFDGHTTEVGEALEELLKDYGGESGHR